MVVLNQMKKKTGRQRRKIGGMSKVSNILCCNATGTVGGACASRWPSRVRGELCFRKAWPASIFVYRKFQTTFL